MCSLPKADIRVSIAFINNENTIPTKIIVLLDMFLSNFDVKLTARNTVNSPKTNPKKGNVNIPRKGMLTPVIMTIPAPTEAPDDTPKVYEDARGFFNTDCITVPLTANAPPTIKANRVRGILKFKTITYSLQY